MWIKNLILSILLITFILSANITYSYSPITVKLSYKNKVIIVDRNFYVGPGIHSAWTNWDKYKIDYSNKLINVSKNEYLDLIPLKTIIIKEVFKTHSSAILILLNGETYYTENSLYNLNTFNKYIIIDNKLINSYGDEFSLTLIGNLSLPY